MIFHCINGLHFYYPFTGWWASRKLESQLFYYGVLCGSDLFRRNWKWFLTIVMLWIFTFPKNFLVMPMEMQKKFLLLLLLLVVMGIVIGMRLSTGLHSQLYFLFDSFLHSSLLSIVPSNLSTSHRKPFPQRALLLLFRLFMCEVV